jgi:predicted CXXCH cytochrome family protein
MQVLANLADACRPCHGRFFGDEVRHSPVADGECATCHEMHRSTLPYLLKQQAPDMCTECHDEPEDLSEDAHAAENVDHCTDCHDPHFGGDMLLKIEK